MEDNTIDINKAKTAGQLGHNNLIAKGYILLKQGSYFTYILKDWLPKFVSAGVLAPKKGVYLPVRDKLHELEALDAQYRKFLENRNYQQRLVDEEMKSLGATEKKLNG